VKKTNKSGRLIEVKIERIVPNGLGIGFAEGLTVFVPLSAVGDKLRVKIETLKKKTAFASIVEIIEPGKSRIPPPCRYFGRCGGCDLQQMDYQSQLNAKVGIIRDCLRRIGKVDYEPEFDIIASPDAWNYRTRAQWKFDVVRRKIGYFERNSHTVCDVSDCPILAPDLQKKLTELRETVSWEDFWQDLTEIEISSSENGVSLKREDEIEEPLEISTKVGDFHYFYNADTFFQVNHLLLEDFVNHAVADVKGKIALDLYCGVGLFTLPLSRNFEQVFGVEASLKSIELARKNALSANRTNVEFFAENTGVWLPENIGKVKNLDLILLDPPRAGADEETIQGLTQIHTKQIVYVSCEPSTLARDLAILTQNHYRISSITAFDMFPQTHHVETIAKLTRG
jgi:23S rRNA (uracil1939-C5)-methyltransferase